ncbi:phosphohydrolase [Kouleothrix aurantiaca]|uniref:Phosphohydrolase n=1 Tax=Kouleothrix aurantiaca TaxID=186479 RepID=A0A0P9DG69_9CHLR|nr:phosphohydrolase [Kouleothrix aurantiaca]
MDTVRAAIAAYIREQALPIDKYSHQPRLYALAVRVGAGQKYDDQILYAAAWLHDLGVFIGHRPEEIEALSRWDNVAYAMERAPALLAEWDFPQEKIAAVQAAIRDHLPARAPETIEGIILRDADILEQLGAVGILRNVSKVGRDTRYPTFAEVLALLRRNLHTLPDQLRLPSARALAAPRIQLLRDFLDAADDEGAGAPL